MKRKGNEREKKKKEKKTRSAGGKTSPRYCIKKTFSHKLRKPTNPCPTHTQRHHSPSAHVRMTTTAAGP